MFMVIAHVLLQDVGRLFVEVDDIIFVAAAAAVVVVVVVAVVVIVIFCIQFLLVFFFLTTLHLFALFDLSFHCFDGKYCPIFGIEPGADIMNKILE